MIGNDKVLNLNVYFVGWNTITQELTNRLTRDIGAAREVWGKCNIGVNVLNNNGRGDVIPFSISLPIGGDFPTRVPNDLAPFFQADNLRCGGNIGNNENPGLLDRLKSFAFDRTADFGISVFYVRGYVLPPINRTTEGYEYGQIGCTYGSWLFNSQGNLQSIKAAVVIPYDPFPAGNPYIGNDRFPYTLSHELGHALFYRQVGPSQMSNNNPSTNYIPPTAGASHDSRFDNVMYAQDPPYPRNSTAPKPIPNNVDNVQCQLARGSRFLTNI